MFGKYFDHMNIKSWRSFYFQLCINIYIYISDLLGIYQLAVSNERFGELSHLPVAFPQKYNLRTLRSSIRDQNQTLLRYILG